MEPKPFKSVDDQIAILRFVGGRRTGEKGNYVRNLGGGVVMPTY